MLLPRAKQTRSRGKRSGQRQARRRRRRRRASGRCDRRFTRAPCGRARRLDGDLGGGLKKEEYPARPFRLWNGGTCPVLLLRIGHHAANGAHLAVEGLRDRPRQGHRLRMSSHHSAPGEHLEQIPLRSRRHEAQEQHKGNLKAMAQARRRRGILRPEASPNAQHENARSAIGWQSDRDKRSPTCRY